MMKKTFAFVLMLVTMIFIGTVEAGIVTDRFPLFCYVDHQVDTYNQPNGQRVGYISANVDLIRVTQVRGDGWAYGDYPGRNGRVARWFRITDICADPGYSNRGVDVSGSHQVYRTKNGGDTIGSISNENVIVLADNGNRAQILYRLNNGTGYKMGWVPSSVVNSRPNPTLKGDVNGDGKVDQSDYDLLLKVYLGEASESQINKANADMNEDGQINLVDVSFLKQKLLNLRNESTPSGDVRQRLLNTIFGRSGGRISCDFDSYVNTPGRHEGIDMVLQNGAEIHAINSGIVTKAGGDSLNTVAIYDPANNKTIVYLHMSSVVGLYVNKKVNKGDIIGYQGSKGASSSHIHLEVRDGQRSAAAKSVNDYKLDNNNPYSYLEKIL